jgi:hypothetical protein
MRWPAGSVTQAPPRRMASDRPPPPSLAFHRRSPSMPNPEGTVATSPDGAAVFSRRRKPPESEREFPSPLPPPAPTGRKKDGGSFAPSGLGTGVGGRFGAPAIRRLTPPATHCRPFGTGVGTSPKHRGAQVSGASEWPRYVAASARRGTKPEQASTCGSFRTPRSSSRPAGESPGIQDSAGMTTGCGARAECAGHSERRPPRAAEVEESRPGRARRRRVWLRGACR